jgi:hypothetical protein
MTRQRQGQKEMERRVAEGMKQFAEWYTRSVNEHGYAAWQSLLEELSQRGGKGSF